MKFTMEAQHKDVLGREIKLGDVVVTLDSNYRSGGRFEVGVVVGTTPKMVRVARPGWRRDVAEPDVQTRQLDKLMVIDERAIVSESKLRRLDTIREQLRNVGFDSYGL